MATHQALRTICQTVVNLLTVNRFNNAHTVEIYTTENFDAPMNVGVSLFPYRIVPNGIVRTPAGRIVNGQRQYVQLPVDLYFMLTAWSNNASTQLEIMTHTIRVMADYPIVPFGLLEATQPGAFHANELVEISPLNASTEDLMHLWENLNGNYRLSIAYLVRNIRIESERLEPIGAPVQTRTFDYTDKPE